MYVQTLTVPLSLLPSLEAPCLIISSIQTGTLEVFSQGISSTLGIHSMK